VRAAARGRRGDDRDDALHGQGERRAEEDRQGPEPCREHQGGERGFVGQLGDEGDAEDGEEDPEYARLGSATGREQGLDAELARDAGRPATQWASRGSPSRWWR
jgi:hypothetical protein